MYKFRVDNIWLPIAPIQAGGRKSLEHRICPIRDERCLLSVFRLPETKNLELGSQRVTKRQIFALVFPFGPGP